MRLRRYLKMEAPRGVCCNAEMTAVLLILLAESMKQRRVRKGTHRVLSNI